MLEAEERRAPVRMEPGRKMVAHRALGPGHTEEQRVLDDTAEAVEIQGLVRDPREGVPVEGGVDRA